MRNIIITGGELFNKGAQAMTFVTVNELKKRFPDHQIYLLSKPPVVVHLAHELLCAVEPVVPARPLVALVHVAVESVPAVGEEMDLGGDLHAPQLAVYLR